MTIIKIGLILFLIKTVNLQLYESPCPDLFEYTAVNKKDSEWFGKIVLVSRTDLLDVWVQLSFDKPFVELDNAFGEVVTSNGTEYFIERANFKLKANERHKFSLVVKYVPGEAPPMLIAFKLNGKLVCDGSLKLNNICGTRSNGRNDDSSNFVQETEEGDFPWHALIYHTIQFNFNYICAATLISNYHVVTVAHCVTESNTEDILNPEDLTVYLGKHYFNRVSEPGVAQDREVENILPHPKYNAKAYLNNIAVVKFITPVEFTDYVRPICLWRESPDLSSVLNKQGIVVGWDFVAVGKPTEKLLRLKLPIISLATCRNSVPRIYSQLTSDNTYCAGYRNEPSVCRGDYGAGMFFPTPNSNSSATVWQLRGLVSIIINFQSVLNCVNANNDKYVVFEDAAKHLDWITKMMRV